MDTHFNHHSKSNFLLPNYFRWPGVILIFMGAILTYIRFGLNINPKIFECKVFAVYSAYFKTSFFSIIENNITEELCGILLLSGLFLVAFAMGKNEKPYYNEIRFRALILSIKITTGILLFSFFFIFGTAFLTILIINVFLPLIIYNLLFFILLYRYEYKHKEV